MADTKTIVLGLSDMVFTTELVLPDEGALALDEDARAVVLARLNAFIDAMLVAPPPCARPVVVPSGEVANVYMKLLGPDRPHTSRIPYLDMDIS